MTNIEICSGLFSLRRKIEDTVIRAELYASSALEMEEASWIKQEEMVRDSDLWDDPTKSNDILVKLANSAKVVDSLKDLRYKVIFCSHRFQLIFHNAYYLFSLLCKIDLFDDKQNEMQQLHQRKKSTNDSSLYKIIMVMIFS